MPSTTPPAVSGATCTCGAATVRSTSPADRGRRLVHLDRAVDTGQVTAAEASERRVELLAR
jgi:hypothetical protein